MKIYEKFYKIFENFRNFVKLENNYNRSWQQYCNVRKF